MIKRIIVPLIGFSAYYYLHKSISFSNQNLILVLKYLNQKDPAYSLFMLRAMMKLSLFKYHKQLQKYIIVRGFDREGRLLQLLEEIGISSVQIGPCSLQPSCAEQKNRQLGIGFVKSNIHTFRDKQKDKVQLFQIGVNITPNYQISKYTPYMLKQNILGCLKEIIELNQISNVQQVNFITLNFNINYLKQLHNQEYFQMIKQLLNQAQKQIDIYNKGKQSNIKLFVQFPKQIVKNFKQIGQQKILIVDENNQFQNKIHEQIDSNSKTSIKQRISQNQFLQKIIKKTLI